MFAGGERGRVGIVGVRVQVQVCLEFNRGAVDRRKEKVIESAIRYTA